MSNIERSCTPPRCIFGASAGVPGSFEWVLDQRLRSPPTLKDTESYWRSLTPEEQDNLTEILRSRKGPNIALRENAALVSNLNRWTNGNGWMMIEGGEHNGQWVNPRYPSTTFQSGQIPDFANNTHIYFPIGNSLTDPEGIACHYEVLHAGTTASIKPNKWHEATTLRYHRRRRQHARRRAQKRRLRRQGLDAAVVTLPTKQT